MRAAADGAVDAVVLTGARRAPSWRERTSPPSTLLTTREASLARNRRRSPRRCCDASRTSPSRLVAAIHGHALGGRAGLELAMACHYRVAPTGTRLSHNRKSCWGLFLAQAARNASRASPARGSRLTWYKRTSRSPATKAQAAGLLDTIVADDLSRASAIRSATSRAEAGRHPSEEPGPWPSFQVCGRRPAPPCERSRQAIRRGTGWRRPSRPSMPSTRRCRWGSSRRSPPERQLFAGLRGVHGVARAGAPVLRRTRSLGRWRASRRARRRREVSRAAVVGAGTMGAGIAMKLCERRHTGPPEGGGRGGARSVASPRIRKNYQSSRARRKAHR